MSSIINYRDICKPCYFKSVRTHRFFFDKDYDDRKQLPCIWCKGPKVFPRKTKNELRFELLVPPDLDLNGQVIAPLGRDGECQIYLDKDGRQKCFCPKHRLSRDMCLCIKCIFYYETYGKSTILKNLYRYNEKYTLCFKTYRVYDEEGKVLDPPFTNDYILNGIFQAEQNDNNC